LGLGAPWVIAATFESNKYGHIDGFKGYYVPGGSLGFSVALFCVLAVLCIIVLVLRRRVVGGELGGANPLRTGSCILLCTFWSLYIIMSIVQSQN
jgi:hypothetical protein